MAWATLLALGAFHGINPAMGWLFAVGLGMQERRRATVWLTLVPLAIGHALAVVVALLAAVAVGVVLPIGTLKLVVAALLISFGATKLVRSRHPRYGGMKMSLWNLVVWSFLMASAHGAGLMVTPLLLGTESPAALGLPATAGVLAGLIAALVHTVGYLAVTGVVATVVYEYFGVLFLRRAWINLDLLWAAALVLTGVATVLI